MTVLLISQNVNCWVVLITCCSAVNGDPHSIEYIRMDDTYVDHGFKSFSVDSTLQCCAACQEDSQCASVSFKGETNTCQLNDRNPDEDPNASVSLVTDWASFKPNKEAQCDSPWLLYNGHCYLIVTAPKTWSAAETHCQTFGSHLVDLQDSAEETFVIEAIESALGDPVNAWIGLNDLEVNGTYAYSSGASVSYMNFADEQPSFKDRRGNIENCVAVWARKQLKWNDAICESTSVSVCKKSVF